MSSSEQTFSQIGQRVPVFEGDKKVTGNIRFVADIRLTNMLHARLVTSPHAHANITSIDTSSAEAMPGVVKILTSADLPDILPTTC